MKKYENVLGLLQSELIKLARAKDPDDFRIRGHWEIALNFQPFPDERLFQYHLIILQTTGQGVCYFHEPRTAVAQLVGQNALSLALDYGPVGIAALDTCYSQFAFEPTEKWIMEGTAYEKATQRSRAVFNEVIRLLEDKNKVSKVGIIGAIGAIARDLIKAGINVRMADLDDNLIGQKLSGVIVEDGKTATLPIIIDSQIVIVTGMTLANGTLTEILSVSRAYHTKVIIVAHTGAWASSMYCQLLHVDIVIAEPFPFYIFEGPTRIHIFRRHAKNTT